MVTVTPGSALPACFAALCAGACASPTLHRAEQDGANPPALDPIMLDQLGTCSLVFDDSTTDPFFITDRVACEFSQLPANGWVQIERVYVTIDRASGGPRLNRHL